MKEVAGTRLSGMTVRGGWLSVVLLVLGVVVLGGTLVAAVLLDRTDETSRQLIDDIQPRGSPRISCRPRYAIRRQRSAATSSPPTRNSWRPTPTVSAPNRLRRSLFGVTWLGGRSYLRT